MAWPLRGSIFGRLFHRWLRCPPRKEPLCCWLITNLFPCHTTRRSWSSGRELFLDILFRTGSRQSLICLIFSILNFENGLGWISLSAYWQSVIRGVFLMIVVIFQSRLVVRRRVA